jgi:hypothetical protein
MISHGAVRGVWVFGRPMLSPRLAWAARSATIRGQWSLGDLLGPSWLWASSRRSWPSSSGPGAGPDR